MLAACAGRAALPDDVRPLARLFTFLVGVTPRAVFTAFAPGGGPLVAGVNLAFASTARVTLSDSSQALFDELLVRLRSANADLRALTRAHDGSANVDVLMDEACEWEGAVTPLAWRDVQEAWAAVAARRGLAHAHDGRVLARLVGDLADAHLVHLEPAPGGAVRLWPTSAAQVVAVDGPPPAPYLQLAAERLQPLAALVKEVAVRAAVEVVKSRAVI